MDRLPLLLLRFRMKPAGLLIVASVCVLAARAADATSPVDHTQRNVPYAPAANGVTPQKQLPSSNSAVQDKRVPTTTAEKPTASLAERRAPIDMKETRDKTVQEKETRRPELNEQPKSAFNQRPASVSTAADTTKPPTVAKYQDSLAAASATNMARFPAIERATTAKINRFVFRKNPPDTAVTHGAAITPAAGGSVIQK